MMRELCRLNAVDNADANAGLEGVATLVIFNGLAAPLYGAWGGSSVPSAPNAGAWDFAIPGESYMTVPVRADSGAFRLVVDYTGAVPSDDVQAVVYGSECAWAPFVGPLA